MEDYRNKWMKINQRFMASEKIPNSRQSAVQADELSNSRYSITKSLDNTYFSASGGIIQSHCNLVWRQDPVTFNFGYMVKTDLTTRVSQCWINELQPFLPRQRLIPESLGMKKTAFGQWFRKRTLFNSLRKFYAHMLCLAIIHTGFSIHNYWLNQLELIHFQNIAMLA